MLDQGGWSDTTKSWEIRRWSNVISMGKTSKHKCVIFERKKKTQPGLSEIAKRLAVLPRGLPRGLPREARKSEGAITSSASSQTDVPAEECSPESVNARSSSSSASSRDPHVGQYHSSRGTNSTGGVRHSMWYLKTGRDRKSQIALLLNSLSRGPPRLLLFASRL